MSSKQPVPHLQLRLQFLRSLFQKSTVIIFLCKDSLAHVLGKYIVTEASALTPIHRGECCPSSQVLFFAVIHPSTTLKQRQSSQIEKKSCSQAGSFRHFAVRGSVFFSTSRGALTCLRRINKRWFVLLHIFQLCSDKPHSVTQLVHGGKWS